MLLFIPIRFKGYLRGGLLLQKGVFYALSLANLQIKFNIKQEKEDFSYSKNLNEINCERNQKHPSPITLPFNLLITK